MKYLRFILVFALAVALSSCDLLGQGTPQPSLASLQATAMAQAQAEIAQTAAAATDRPANGRAHRHARTNGHTYRDGDQHAGYSYNPDPNHRHGRIGKFGSCRGLQCQNRLLQHDLHQHDERTARKC